MIKRLFISTGFYSTLISSVVAERKEGFFEDHLIITIDRQSAHFNKLWAHRLHSWESIDTIEHADYYIEKIAYQHAIKYFDEVYSPFPEMNLVVSEAFPSGKQYFYEEGLTSYLQFFEGNYPPDSTFFCLHPFFYNNFTDLISLPVSISDTRNKLELLQRCYQIPILEKNNNIIVIGQGGFQDENKSSLVKVEYINYIKKYSQQGYHVILLGHTRYPVDPELIKILDEAVDISFTYMEHNAPISDLFLIKNSKKINLVTGVYSTLLVNSRQLCGVDCQSFNSQALSERQQKLKDIQARLLE